MTTNEAIACLEDACPDTECCEAYPLVLTEVARLRAELRRELETRAVEALAASSLVAGFAWTEEAADQVRAHWEAEIRRRCGEPERKEGEA